MLDQFTNASTLSAMGAASVLAVLLYICIRLRRLERQTQIQVDGIKNTAERLEPAAPPAPTTELAPADIPGVDAQFAAISQRLDSIAATLGVIAAGERPIVVTKIMAWPFDDALAQIRRNDMAELRSGDGFMCRFLNSEAAEHTKISMELMERGGAVAELDLPADLTQLPLHLAKCGFHIALNGHFLIGSVTAILAHAKLRQIGRKLDRVEEQLQFLIDARTGDHVATLQSLWEDARDQSQRPTEPGARRQMRHIAEQLSRQRFIWIHEFSQSFLTAARSMYRDTAGEKNATERAIPSCIDTAERLVIAITLDYFVRLALEEPGDWLALRLNNEAKHVKTVIKRCLREWRQHLPKNRNWQWQLDVRLRRHKIMSQAIDQLRVYGRVLAMLSNTSQSPIPSVADTPAAMSGNPTILPARSARLESHNALPP